MQLGKKIAYSAEQCAAELKERSHPKRTLRIPTERYVQVVSVIVFPLVAGMVLVRYDYEITNNILAAAGWTTQLLSIYLLLYASLVFMIVFLQPFGDALGGSAKS